MLKRHRSAVLIVTLLTLTACSDPDDDVTPPPAVAASAPAAGPSAAGPADAPSPAGSPATPGPARTTTTAPTTTATAATGRPEIVTNPDGTINSGGPRPATSDSALTAGGFGPYRIGAAQQELAAAKLIGKVTSITSECAGYATAKGIARHHAPQLTFYEGRLLRLTLTSEQARTDRGVTIGTPMSDVQQRYPEGKPIDDFTGRSSWLAAVGDFGLLFDVRDDKVAALQAGMAEPMRFKYTDDQGC